MATEMNSESYVVGIDLARNFRKYGVELDVDSLVRGLQDGLEARKPAFEERDIRRIRVDFRNDVMHRVAASQRTLALENRRKADEFLQANGAEEGVVTLPSGVQYRALSPGEGRCPTDADWVACEYRGTLLDGTRFDGTDAGKPANLKVAQLIPGWREVLRMMPAGSRWQVFIPPQHAYGERGVADDIGPNELLTFDVHLVSIQ